MVSRKLLRVIAIRWSKAILVHLKRQFLIGRWWRPPWWRRPSSILNDSAAKAKNSDFQKQKKIFFEMIAFRERRTRIDQISDWPNGFRSTWTYLFKHTKRTPFVKPRGFGQSKIRSIRCLPTEQAIFHHNFQCKKVRRAFYSINIKY